MEKLIVLNNERVSQQNGKFFSRNYNFKILPEGLNKYFDVEYIVRKSNINESHELNLNTVKIATNIIQFIFFVISTFKNKNTRYYIICITPYTFIASLFLFIFRKKVFVYLISSGHEEWKSLLGSWSVWIYNFMYQIVTSNSTVIALHDRLYDNNKKFHVINSSSLDENWLMNFKEAKIDKIRFLYVARINPVKGINEFLEMFKDIELDAELSIIGKTNNLKHQKEFKTIMKNNKNIKFPGYISNRQDLINTFDEHNILILPSYTEGQPYVVDESLARRRPVLIFEDIKHIIKGRKGIFVSKRNIASLTDTTKFIMTNYNKIQRDIEKNKFPLEKDMFKEISNVILND
jgi:glycosyltransferase involved in cell wall biosynthesis